MKRTIGFLLAASVLASIPSPSAAGALEDGTSAFGRGDYADAEKLLAPLARQGVPSAQGIVGAIYTSGMFPDGDSKIGLELLRKGAAADDPGAEYALAAFYQSGRLGLPRDEKEAANWMQKAAAHPDTGDAQLALARMYGVGAGVPQSPDEAQRWYEKAVASFTKLADRGVISAKVSLASMYLHGEGIRKDEGKANQLYQSVALEYAKGAEQGSPLMQAKLAGAYLSGLGVPKDRLQGYLWLRRAADQGDSNSMIRLALFYTTLGFPIFAGGSEVTNSEDEVQSCIWLRLAFLRLSASEADQARQMVADSMRRLTDSQRERVEAAVKSWQPVREGPGEGRIGPVTAAQAAELQRLKAELTAH